MECFLLSALEHLFASHCAALSPSEMGVVLRPLRRDASSRAPPRARGGARGKRTTAEQEAEREAEREVERDAEREVPYILACMGGGEAGQDGAGGRTLPPQ